MLLFQHHQAERTPQAIVNHEPIADLLIMKRNLHHIPEAIRIPLVAQVQLMHSQLNLIVEHIVRRQLLHITLVPALIIAEATVEEVVHQPRLDLRQVEVPGHQDQHLLADVVKNYNIHLVLNSIYH